MFDQSSRHVRVRKFTPFGSRKCDLIDTRTKWNCQWIKKGRVFNQAKRSRMNYTRDYKLEVETNLYQTAKRFSKMISRWVARWSRRVQARDTYSKVPVSRTWGRALLRVQEATKIRLQGEGSLVLGSSLATFPADALWCYIPTFWCVLLRIQDSTKPYSW